MLTLCLIECLPLTRYLRLAGLAYLNRPFPLFLRVLCLRFKGAGFVQSVFNHLGRDTPLLGGVVKSSVEMLK